MDVERYRLDTPGCKTKVHLNNAGSGLMPRPVVNAITDHIKLESEIGGYEAQDMRREAIQDAYQSVAKLIEADAIILRLPRMQRRLSRKHCRQSYSSATTLS